MRFLWVVFAWMVVIAGLLVFPPISIIMLILLFVFRKKKEQNVTVVVNSHEPKG